MVFFSYSHACLPLYIMWYTMSEIVISLFLSCLLPHMRMCPVSSSVSLVVSSMMNTMLSIALNWWMSASLWLTAALKYHFPRYCRRWRYRITARRLWQWCRNRNSPRAPKGDLFPKAQPGIELHWIPYLQISKVYLIHQINLFIMSLCSSPEG